MIPFLAIHAKGGESMSPKQKDRTTTLIWWDFQFINFKIGISLCSKGGASSIFKTWYPKTLLNTKRRIYLRGSFVKSKEKHLKQGEKISKLENALQTLIHLPLTICKRTLKRFTKDFAKTKHVVQAWSKMLKMKKQSMHIL
jgi:hypothetical protein